MFTNYVLLNLITINILLTVKTKIKIFYKLVVSVIIFALAISCVDSISDTQGGSATVTPTIEVYTPKTGDTIMVGKHESFYSNYVNYQAADGSGGQGLSHFELFINGGLFKKYTIGDDGVNPNIFLQIDSTLLNTKIKYYLVVYNKQGKLKTSKTQENIFVKDKPPAAPTSLVLAKTSETSVTLLWNDNSKNENGFELWRKDVAVGNIIDYRRIKTFPKGPGDIMSTSDIGLSPYATYYYMVRAYNNSGFSNYSNEVSTTDLSGGPWYLKAEGIGASAIRLTWTDFVPNELGFIIERTDPNTTEYKLLTITAPNKTEYYDTNVKANTAYTYRLAYFLQTSKSPYSNEASASTFNKDYYAPSELDAVYVYGVGVNLSWKDLNKHQHKGTVIERRLFGAEDFKEVVTAVTEDSTAVDKSAILGNTYIYRARHILDKNIYTTYSNEKKLEAK